MKYPFKFRDNKKIQEDVERSNMKTELLNKIKTPVMDSSKIHYCALNGHPQKAQSFIDNDEPQFITSWFISICIF